MIETFRDDSVLQIQVEGANKGFQDINTSLPVTFGLASIRDESVKDLHTKAGLLASSYVLEKFEEFIRDKGLTFMLVLLRSKKNVINHLNGEPSWDQAFLDTLKNKDYPVLDLRDFHRKEFERYTDAPEEYLHKYYIGHYTPEGNFFTALSLRATLVNWLEDSPKPYASIQ